MRFLSLLLGVVLLGQGAGAQHDMIDVRDCGARGDGQSDDTAAFEQAVAQAQAARQQVYVPRGQYVLSRTLTLAGTGLTGPTIGAWPADIDALPSLLVSRSGGPALHLLAGASVQGLDFTCGGPTPERDGPPVILISGIGCYLRNLRIRYPWDGIVTDGKSNVGRLNIENVFMVSPLNVGVRVTGTWDVPALRNVEVWNAGPVPRGLQQGIGFHLGKNDLIRVTDCFAFAMRYGFLLADRIEGCEITGGTWGLLTGCSTDYCGTGVCVQGENTVSITGGTFWDHGEGLRVEGKGARVRLTGAELQSNGAPAVVVAGGDQTVITGCTLTRPMAGFPGPVVHHSAGTMLCNDNIITAVAGPGVRLEPAIAAAVVEGNLMRVTSPQLVDDNTGDRRKAIIRHNLAARDAQPGK